MNEFKYTDKDGDHLDAGAITTNPPFVARIGAHAPDYEESVWVGLTADAARDLAAKLTAWAGEVEPEFKVGDRVRIVRATYAAEDHGKTGTVISNNETRSAAGEVHPYEVRMDDSRYNPTLHAVDLEHYTPDYAAIAATFKPGDLAIVGDNPDIVAVGVEPVHGCDDDFAGKGVTVVAKDEDDAPWLEEPYGDEPAPVFAELVRVSLGDGCTNYIHVAHLTRVEAVKW